MLSFIHPASAISFHLVFDLFLDLCLCISSHNSSLLRIRWPYHLLLASCIFRGHLYLFLFLSNLVTDDTVFNIFNSETLKFVLYVFFICAVYNAYIKGGLTTALYILLFNISHYRFSIISSIRISITP